MKCDCIENVYTCFECEVKIEWEKLPSEIKLMLGEYANILEVENQTMNQMQRFFFLAGELQKLNLGIESIPVDLLPALRVKANTINLSEENQELEFGD